VLGEEVMRTRIFLAIMVLSALIRSGSCFAQAAPASVSSEGSPKGETADKLNQPDTKQERVFDDLDQLDRRLHELEARKEELVRLIARTGQEHAQGSNNTGKSEKDPDRMRAAAKARLVALYKFKQMGYAIPLLSARDLTEAIEAGYLTAKLLHNDQQLFLGLQDRTIDAASRNAVASLSKEELNGLKLELSTVEQELLSAQKAKIGMLDQVRRQESLSARYDAKIEEDQKILEKRALNRKPIFGFQAKPFSGRQGSLPFPTRGEITGTFGSKTHVSSHAILYNGGIIITAPKGEQVQAIHEGMVMFADWFKEYGKVMIIDHGDHYYSLIAHADQLFRQVGETVKEGEVIATVGDTGSLDGPKLYFEIRRNGKPVDPMEWLAARKLSKE